MSDDPPGDSFTFLHAADVHLDSPLRGLERYEGAPVDAIRGASRRAFENLVELAIEEAVDFVLIAGDLYDGDWRDYNTGLYFVQQMARLHDAGIPVLVISGNHDASSRITRHLHPPPNVHLLRSDRPETRLLDGLAVAVHGQGFASAAVTDNLSLGYPAPVAGRFNIGMLHTALTGREGHAPYAPCTTEDLRARRYDYWALGHVHRREVISEQPWIVFPGNLQGRHARETGAKGASLVTVEHGAVHAVTHRALDVVRFFDEVADVSGCDGVDEVWPRVEALLARCAAAAEGTLLAVRVRLTGACAAHSELRACHEQVVAQCRALAAAVASDVWVEKVLLDTSAPADMAATVPRDDLVGSLLHAVRDLEDDEQALARLGEDFSELRGKLPRELTTADDGFDPTAPEELRAALDDAQALLVDRLGVGGRTR